MKHYFGPGMTKATLLVAGLITYIVYMVLHRHEIVHWGRHVAILAFFGLYVCVVAATRDNYHLSVQNAIDGSVASGLFTTKSIQSIICCVCGGVIALGSISAIFIRHQGYFRGVFMVVACAILIKILVIELSRVLIR